MVLKRTLVILFCFFYFLSSVGVAFNLHYCGGKLKSISFSHSDEKNCCGKKMKSKNCCKEKSVVYKVKGNQDTSGKYFSFKNNTNIFVAHIHSSGNYLEKRSFNLFFLPDFHDPPDIDYSSTYLVNRTFRI